MTPKGAVSPMMRRSWRPTPGRGCGARSPSTTEPGQVKVKYHHVGIPTDVIRGDETHLPELGMYVSGYEASEFGVEWMRFDAESPLPELVRTVPHVAFEVPDLEAALEGREVVIPPNSPSPGVRVAFIVENGAPVEFLEMKGPRPNRHSA